MPKKKGVIQEKARVRVVNSPPSEPEPKPKRILVGIILFIALFAVLGGIYIVLGYVKNDDKKLATANSSENMVSPTPFPFQEVTIPHLRQKSFISTLGSREVAYENDQYTAYLTSYTSDGLNINGLLTIPHGEKPAGGWPAIVFIHGYIPPVEYSTNGEAYSSYVDYLARSGFVVFKIDLRGHGTSEGLPGGGYYGADYVTDTLNAYSALASSDFVNPKKIGLWGHSMAGNAILRSLAVRTDIPAVVIWAGAVYSYTDMVKYGISDSSYQPNQTSPTQQRRRQGIRQQYGDPNPENFFWKQMAPTNYLSDMKGAIQIHHAIDDDVVNIGYSRDLITLLDNTSIPHELVEHPIGGHNISGVSFTNAMQSTVEFFKKYLSN